LFLSFLTSATAQTATIEGKVVDNKSKVVELANVAIVGESIGATTNKTEILV